MKTLQTPDEIEHLVATGGVVITPSRQWATELQGRLMHADVGVLPEVYSVTSWVELLWDDLAFKAVQPFVSHAIVNPTQEQALWRLILQGDDTLHERARVSLAALCQDALDKCILYRQPLDSKEYKSLQALTRLHAWVNSFSSELDSLQMVTRAQALEWLVDRLPEEHRRHYPAVVLYGFAPVPGDELGAELGPEPTPLLQEFINACCSEEVYLHQAPAPAEMPEAMMHIYPDLNEELAGAAEWAASNPNKRLQIIVPGLAGNRNQVAVALSEYLSEDEWYISQGEPLSDKTVYRTLRRWLSLACDTLEAEHLYELGRSRVFYAGGDRLQASGWLEQQLRRSNAWNYDIGTLNARLKRLNKREQPHKALLSHWLQGLGRLQKMPKQQGFSAWAECFYQQWQQLGAFAGLNATTARQLETLLSNLHGLSTLEAREDVPLAEALEWLDWFAGRQRQYTRRDQQRVLVGASLDVTGTEVDCTWIVGFDAQNWPRPIRGNPLLPGTWQREKSMPGASEQASGDFARHLLMRLASRSKQLILSLSPNQAGIVEESRLLELFPDYVYKEVTASGHEHLELYEMEDSIPDNWTDSERLQSSYVRTIAQMHLDPFRAFVEARLGGVDLEQPEMPSSAKVLGLHLHWFMSHLMPVGSRGSTGTPTEEQLHPLVERLHGQLPEALLEDVTRVLFDTAATWCNYEEELGWDSTVAHTEIGLKGNDDLGIPYAIRLDRVDELSGKVLIVDYKSAEAQSAGIYPLGQNGIQLALYGILYQRCYGLLPSGLLYAWMDLKQGEQRKPALAGVLDESLESLLPSKPSRRIKFVNMQEHMDDLQEQHHQWLERFQQSYLSDARPPPQQQDSLLLLRPPGTLR